MKRASFVFASGLALSASCATVTSQAEYGAFRTFRYESNTERRIHLGAEYMEHYPNGQFRSVVQADVLRREEDFWEEKRSTLEGLQVYLRAFPAGVHVQEANARVQAYENERRAQDEARRERERQERERLDTERRAANERQRRFARDTMVYWLRSIGVVEGWGERLGTIRERNAEFATAFGGAPEPAPRPNGVRKTYPIDFTVPVPGRTALSRRLNLSFDLITRLVAPRDRRVVQSQLVLHNRGLTAWFECETQGQCDPTDPEQRARSVRWSMDQLRGIVATAYPEARETPTNMAGPEPEMEGELGAEEASDAAAPATAAPAIPPQPLGVQFSYVVGCGANIGGAQISAPEGSLPPNFVETAGPPLPVRSCLRIDAWSAPEIQGVSTDEGLRISFIPATAIPQPAPARGRPGARPAAPGARPAAARPAAAAPR